MPAYLGIGRLQRHAVGWHGWDRSQPLIIAIPTDKSRRLARAPKRQPCGAVTSIDRLALQLTAPPYLAALRAAKYGVFHDPNDHQFLELRPQSQKTAFHDNRSQV